MLLGAARVLAADPDFAGTVHFIFQPAEEGQGGASAMIEDGLFDRFPATASMPCTIGPACPPEPLPRAPARSWARPTSSAS
ncbi:M20/M25/M40 family metallo-hydrolase [Novosphingobium pokkalii]|uniref:M20/M25/M40 family metallo-hydrolase n=1 Tax=Novosphingobium pokkalii TaxID=1770194 RepID=UPI003645DE2A